MLKSRLLALCAFLSLCVFSASAVIVRIDILKGKNPKTGQEQYVYLLSDTHNKFLNMGIPHRVALLKILTHQSNQKKLIVEDSFADQHIKQVKIPFFTDLLTRETTRSELLPFFSDLAKYTNVEIVNIDHRGNFKLIRDFEDLRLRFDTSKSSFKEKIKYYPIRLGLALYSTYYEPTLKDLLEIVFKELAKIRNYQDGETLNGYYRKVIHKIKYESSSFISFAYQSLNGKRKKYPKLINFIKKIYEQVSEKVDKLTYIDRVFLSNPYNIFNIIQLFDTEIIDLNALHEIVNTNKEKNFVVLGGFHVYNVKKILEQIGYINIFSYGSDMNFSNFNQIKINDLFNVKSGFASNVNITKNNCKPINTSMLKQLLSEDPEELRHLQKQEKQLLSLDSNKLFPDIQSNQRMRNRIDYYTITHSSNFKK